jgi:hypothetical protein
MNEDTETKILLDWLVPEKEADEENIIQKGEAYDRFYNAYFEKDLKRLMMEYLLRRDQYANTQDDLMVVKGIMRGFEIIKRHFEHQVNISKSDIEEE